jgi:uncharacterized protein involved in response to NO
VNRHPVALPLRTRMQTGAWLAKGFRPFFLLAAASASLLVPVWLLVWTGRAALRGPLQGAAWHAHEMIFGFAAAAMAGFLLTAVSNWTGRETLAGPRLGLLALVWLAGRAAMLLLPGFPASLLELLFLPLLVAAIGRPLWAARDARNAGFPLLLLALWLADLVVHAGAHSGQLGLSLAASRVAVHLVIVVLLLVTGRVVPMFTRNATGVEVTSRPWLDRLAVGSTLGVALAQALPLPAPAVALLSAVAAAAVALRMVGWGTLAAGREPLLWVLHAAHAAIAVGLGLQAASALWPLPLSASLHALTVGAIGLSILGMMARVALGHTGRPLRASPAVTIAFGLLLLAAALRVGGPLLAPAWLPLWWWASGGAWSLAFALYVVVYAPILSRPRPDGKPG